MITTFRRNVFQEILAKGHDEDFNPPLPEVAVDHKPGSWEKICTMEERVQRGEDLFHPDDFREHVCTHEQALAATPKVQEAVGSDRTSPEFVSRQEKFKNVRHTKKQKIKPSPKRRVDAAG